MIAGVAPGIFVLLAAAGCGASSNVGATNVESSIVATVGGNAGLLKNPITDVKALFTDRSVDLIVKGTVTDIEYRYADGAVALTGLTVAVENARGDSTSEITTWESGGLIPVSDIPDQKREKMLEGKDVSADSVIDFRPSGGAERAKVGDRVVLFLRAIKVGPTAGDYYTIGDTLGRFALNGSGDYVRAGAVDGNASETRPALDKATLATQFGKS